MAEGERVSPLPPLNLGDILDNGPGSSELSGPVRILDIQYNGSDSLIWLIDRERPCKDNSNQRKSYVRQPYARRLSEIEELLRASKCVVVNIQSKTVQYTDQDRLNACASEKARAKLRKQFKERDERFAAIRPIVCKPDGHQARPVSEVVSDPTFARQIDERARELQRTPLTLRRWINRYWTSGSVRSALFAGYLGRCGNPGVEKKQESKLGRSPRLFKTQHWKSRGYPLSQLDKQRLGYGFALISRETPARDAYLLTCSAYWAVHEESPTGEVKAVLFPRELRPSFDQFMRWGEKKHGKSVREILLGPTKSAQIKKTSGKSEQDSLVAVGQQSMFDGTSNDVYLVSFRSRLKKLPPMTRLILKESRSGIIFGVYCGWEPASPRTALLTILHGALRDKRSWASRFGVDIDEGAIPGLLTRSVLADNGELKGQESTEFEQQFGIGFHFTPAMRGDAKGGVETEHDRMHSHLDHKIPGSTHGKPRKRGEVNPASEALWNYAEYMSELIKHIIWHNCEEEVPNLAPDGMLLAEPSVKPTRINIYNWFTRQGLNVGLNFDYNDLRAYNLPDVQAVICKNGIRLIGKVHGRKMRLLRLRYTSDALAKTGLMEQVKLTGKDIPTMLKMDTTDLSQAWLPTRNGLIRVVHSPRDKIINKNLVLDEWITYCEDQAIRGDLLNNERDQQGADKVQRFAAVTESARAEVKTEISMLNKKPSLVSIVSHLEQNRREELALLREQDQQQLDEAAISPTLPVDEVDDMPPTLADHAMSRFLGNE
ncbi:hypothetical protein [Acidovorax sp. K2F]|uniref:hypothetical protein n=1 Tax=Acidovorax sp. K2F TaxID=2978125 RepID=UPI0021B0BCDC|nr:hypothetical protein [Acidovorax sp. K2F]MCT6721161.1 hypothetical protein [Acidovorax sp. K2F]